MHPRRPAPRRTAATMVETAVVISATLLLVVGMIVVALGVFRYQQVAAAAREGARWASVHGGQYAKETGQAKATPSSVYNNAILPMASGLNTNSLSYSVTWDDAGEMPNYYNYGTQAWTSNNVTVTVTYSWVPEAFFGGVTLTSTSVMPMSY